MDILSGTTVLSNLLGALVSAFAIYQFAVRPIQKRLEKSEEALNEATSHLTAVKEMHIGRKLEELTEAVGKFDGTRYVPAQDFTTHKAENTKTHSQLFGKIETARTEADLRFVLRREWEQEKQDSKEFRNELKVDVKKLLQRTATLATDRTDE